MTAVHERSVILLLPTLNEEKGIEEVLLSLPQEEMENRGYDLDVVVVDGHSTDRTTDIARSYGARIVGQKGTGKGCAFRTGLDLVRCTYLLMMDADNSYPPEDLPKFLDLLEEGYDVVMGSRIEGEIQPGAMSSTNFLGNRLLSFLASVLYRQKVTDVCTGMWGFNFDALKELFLNSTRFELEAELFAQATKKKLKVAEIPISYRRRDGTAKLAFFKDAVSIAFKLIRKRFVE